MRYAVLGDVHSNLSALEAVLEAVDREGVERILQVGDVVGYGAAPVESIALLRAREARVVMGNHDGACAGKVDPRTFNDNARLAVRHNVRQLGRADRRWLADLPLTLDEEHCSMAHGTLNSPAAFEYIQSVEDANPSLDLLELPVCFVGHTHRPVTIMRLMDAPHRTSYTFSCDIDLADASRSLVNVGSVGQPRDEDPRAAYAIFDSEERSIRLERVDYDIEREADRILRAGLPKILADRLFLGI